MQTARSLIYAVKRMAGEAGLRLVLFLSSFGTNNIYIFGKDVMKHHANGLMFSRLTSMVSLRYSPI